MSNKYNNSKHDPVQNAQGSKTKQPSEHGELRSGRLSMFKNHNPIPSEPANEYLDDVKD
ncbi:hypothetical protein [Paenibacillus sp. GCM10027626]|uniref:hypothetical protein n=1 Tax=Paenibacillus sp. GCM10027626 TaxID=3273411 RepID=UPI00362993B2